MNKPRVLVVDDDAVLGMLLGEMLGEMGLFVCGIETTQDGAISAALQLKPDLMIVDGQLSPGSGAAVMAAIEIYGKIPHVFMSGERLVADSNGVPILLKPFSEDSLAVAIDCAMNRHSPKAAPAHE
jgi:DNA-binding response OmpR family regulator